MNSKDVIQHTLGTADFLLNAYIDDLTDADLLVAPVEGMNHIAWQLGHLISSERMFIENVKPGASPVLAAEFEAVHSRSDTKGTSPSQFASKAEYLNFYKAQRKATLDVIAGLTDADLDKASPESFAGYAPTIGCLLNMIGAHYLMHLGQFVAVRRVTGKKIAV